MADRSFHDKYMQHFTMPQNIGELTDPDGACEVHHEGGGCLDKVKMSIKVENGTIADIKYKLRACSGTIAASSAATSLVKGKSLEEADKIDFDMINEELGIVPEKKHHSIELAVRALQEAVADYRRRNSR